MENKLNLTWIFMIIHILRYLYCGNSLSEAKIKDLE